MEKIRPFLASALAAALVCGGAEASSVLLDAMEAELARAMETMGSSTDVPLYYMQYTVTDESRFELSAADGGFNAPESSRLRYLDVDIRVGSMSLDNTHEIRGGGSSDNYPPRRVVQFPIQDEPGSARATLWAETEYQYHKAVDRYSKVVTNRQIKVEEADKSADFSPMPPHQYAEVVVPTRRDTSLIRPIMRRAAKYFTEHSFVLNSGVSFTILDKTTYLVSSEGHRLQFGNRYLRMDLTVVGMANDGMELSRHEGFSAAVPEHLPDETTVMKTAERLVKELRLLIDAPEVEPYLGPAILRSRASGVFFHEIFGHRVEGHRQKRTDEGQTFTKKIGESILPPFISVYDDPTVFRHGKHDLRGYYAFDDEGTPAQRVTIVERGVLKGFLMSRSPIDGFPLSNGHGRRQYGYDVVSRQGNLIVESSETVPWEELRRRLIAECERQGKPYGLVFEDIGGGFTTTARRGPQAFKVLPLLVTRVYTDGRPDEIVRGVDIVGTPLTSFNKIICTGDDYDVFNGTCGAESGMVPASCISPSILVSEIEVEKRQKAQEKPPILPPPRCDAGGAAVGTHG
ncbi:MAG: metallopeptidase TldD-related protein [Candidatus Eisenbacteria bacterium]|nr:metallopeptidase TldD-related protein [Candidatus Eisenbacteria bacterium]